MPAKARSNLALVDGQILGPAGDVDVEDARGQAIGDLGRDLGRTAKGAAGQRAEGGNVICADGAVEAGQRPGIGRGDLPLAVECDAGPVDRQAVQNDRCALRPVQRGPAVDAVAKGGLRAFVRQRDAFRGKGQGGGDRLGAAFAGANDAAAVQGDTVDICLIRVQPVQHDVSGPVGPCFGIELDVQVKGINLQIVAHGQQNRVAGWIGDAALDVDQLRRLVGIQRDLSGQFDGPRRQHERVQRQPAVRILGAAGNQANVIPEERFELRREDRGKIAPQFAFEPPSAICGADTHLSGQPFLSVGIKFDIRLEIRQGARSFDRQVDRGSSGQGHQPRGDAVFGLAQRQIKVQLFRAIVETAGQAQAAGGPVGAFDGQFGLALAAGKAGRPFDRQFDLFAQDRRAQADLFDRHFTDPHGHGQVGQLERLRLGVGQIDPLFRLWQARHLDRLGGQAVNLKPPKQQGAAAPIQFGADQRQPHPLVVRDGHPIERGRGRQRALEAGHDDLAARSGQQAFDLAFQKAAVVGGLGDFAVLRRCGQGQQGGKAKAARCAFQNACPMPM